MLLHSDKPFLLDGATGSELERRGVDVSLPLWSARAIFDAPEILKQVHQDYLNAGADAIITNTFRTHERSLAKAAVGDRAQELTQEAVNIARDACRELKSDAKIFGSVAPLEDCYDPNLAPDAHVCKQEHEKIIRHLVEADVDLVLIETMCEANEAIVAATVAKERAPAWAISFCLSNHSVGKLLDGTSLSGIISKLDGAKFIGINCVDATTLNQHIKHLRKLLPSDIPIAAYGNVGYANHENGWTNTDAVEPEQYAKYAMEWFDSGANIVGGCCGTTPESIQAIYTRINKNPCMQCLEDIS